MKRSGVSPFMMQPMGYTGSFEEFSLDFTKMMNLQGIQWWSIRDITSKLHFYCSFKRVLLLLCLLGQESFIYTKTPRWGFLPPTAISVSINEVILEVIVIREKPEMKFHTTADYLDEEPIQKSDGLQLANSSFVAIRRQETECSNNAGANDIC